MEYVKYRLTLDMTEEATQYVIPIKIGDNARQFDFVLTNKGKPYTLEGCTAVFRGLNPDGSVVYNECEINNNVITYTLTTSTSQSIGLIECELTLYGADEKVITSPRFSLVCGDKVYSDDEVEGRDEFTALVDALIAVQRLNVSAEKVGNTTTITITRADGTTSEVHINDGTPGTPGFSPTVTTETISGGHRVTITDAEGPHSFNVMDGQGGGGESLPVFFIEWHDEPTTQQKQAIVDTFEQIAAIADSKYLLYLTLSSGLNILAQSVSANIAIFADSGRKIIPVNYYISAQSVEEYSQRINELVEYETFDPEGYIPANQDVIANYIEGQGFAKEEDIPANRIFIQPTQPEDLAEGDLWLDTSVPTQPVISEDSTDVPNGGEVYSAIQAALYIDELEEL